MKAIRFAFISLFLISCLENEVQTSEVLVDVVVYCEDCSVGYTINGEGIKFINNHTKLYVEYGSYLNFSISPFSTADYFVEVTFISPKQVVLVKQLENPERFLTIEII